MTRRPSYAMNFDLRNRRDDARKNAQIRALRLSPPETVAMLTRDDAKYRQEMHEFASKFMGPPGDVLFRCGAGHGMCIDAYGRAQPCMGIRAPELTVALPQPSPARYPPPTPPASQGESSEQGREQNSLPLFGGFPNGGRAGDGGLAAALAQFAALRDLRATNPDYLRRCARCFLKGLCEQCPAKSWAEHGTLDTPVEYLCDVAHAQARYLGWLGENERGWEVGAWRECIAQSAAVNASRDLA